jgi:hypothetical protein
MVTRPLSESLSSHPGRLPRANASTPSIVTLTFPDRIRGMGAMGGLEGKLEGGTAWDWSWPWVARGYAFMFRPFTRLFWSFYKC